MKSQEHAVMDQEIRGKVTTLTDHLMGLGKEDGDGTKVVVLTGENKGAVTKVNLQEMMDTHGALHADETGLGAYANSNYQAVNNSIVFGESCTAEDPGVHIDIYENNDEEDEHESNEWKAEKDKSK